MKVYTLSTEESCGWLIPLDKSIWMISLRFDGQRKGEQYSPIEVTLTDDGLLCDNMPLAAGASTFSEKSVDLLMPIMGSQVEVLPLSFKTKQYFLINVINVLDCIDYEASEFERFEPNGRIMFFYKYSFREDKLLKSTIFKITDELEGRPFFTDAFVDFVKKSDLRGFRFELVWDSDGIEISDYSLF
jgi:hypothetical protein